MSNTIFTGLPNFPTAPTAPSAPTGARGSEGGSFGDSLTSAIHSVDQLDQSSQSQVTQLMSGERQDIHNVMVAVEKADVAFQLMMQVRNKIVNAYQEVSKLQF